MPDQWMTYQQAGEALGVSPDAVRRHAQRKGWRVQRGNDGKALVLIPATATDERWARAGAQQGARAPAQSPGHVRGVPPELVAELRRRAEGAEARADTAEALARAQAGQIAELRQDLGRAEGEAQVLQAAVAHERAQVAAERTRADELQGRLDVVQAELAERDAGGPLARAWRALVYRRGRP